MLGWLWEKIQNTNPLFYVEINVTLRWEKVNYVSSFFFTSVFYFSFINSIIVSKNTAQELALEFGISYFETSAKDRMNIEESVFELIRAIRKVQRPVVGKKKKSSQEPQLKNLPDYQDLPKVWENIFRPFFPLLYTYIHPFYVYTLFDTLFDTLFYVCTLFTLFMYTLFVFHFFCTILIE